MERITIEIVDKSDALSPKKNKLKHKNDDTVIFVPDGDYGDEVIFVEPENYSPKKRLKLDQENRLTAVNQSHDIDSEISVAFERKGIDFPHAREHCKFNKFAFVNVLTKQNASNEKFCEKCYCFVCDDLASKCELWNTGTNPHCNSHAKHAFWEKEKALHKRNAKKNFYVSMFSSLPPILKSDSDLVQAAAVAQPFIQSIQAISDSTYSDMSAQRSCCGCICHYESQSWPTDGAFGCFDCIMQHRKRLYSSAYQPYLGQNEFNLAAKIKEVTLNATMKASSYLARNLPSAAIVVLEIITSVLFDMDLSKGNILHSSKTLAIGNLIPCWIEAALHPLIDKVILDKAKECLHKLTQRSTGVFLPEAQKLHSILKDLLMFDDPLVVSCLKGKKGLEELVEVTKVRLEILKKNKRFSEAIYYILGVQFKSLNYHVGFNAKTMTECPEHRRHLIELLVQERRVYEAVNVCHFPYNKKLPDDLTKCYYGTNSYRTGKKSKPTALAWCPIKDMPADTCMMVIKGLLQARNVVTINKNRPMNISPEEQRIINATCFSLPLLCTIGKVSKVELCDLLLDSFAADCAKSYPQYNASQIKVIHEKAMKVIEKAKHGQVLVPDDLEPPTHPDVTMRVYITELLSMVMATKVSLNQCMQSLIKKELLWACVSVLISPVLSYKMTSTDLGYFVEKVLPKTGSSRIPLEIFERWFKGIDGMKNFKVLYKLVCEILAEGERMKGVEGDRIKAKAVLSSYKIRESIIKHSNGHTKDTLCKNLSILKNKFSNEAYKMGISGTFDSQKELEFIDCPSFKTFEAVRKSYGKQYEELWDRKRANLLDFLATNVRIFPEACIEIYCQLEMYEELKKCLESIGDLGPVYKRTCEKISHLVRATKSKASTAKLKELIDALKHHISRALSYGCLYNVERYQDTSEIVKDVLVFIHGVSPGIFTFIITEAIAKITQVFLTTTVHYAKRKKLADWLLQVKAIYTTLCENAEWKAQYQSILCGPLKRKPAIITQLQQSIGY